jgi:hypothetical protein
MTKQDLRTLIYSKQFSEKLTHKLLFIIDSDNWEEGLLDIAGEHFEKAYNQGYSDGYNKAKYYE